MEDITEVWRGYHYIRFRIHSYQLVISEIRHYSSPTSQLLVFLESLLVSFPSAIVFPTAHMSPGGLYFDTDVTIAGFQSRVGCLFFLVCFQSLFIYFKTDIRIQGALVAFSALSALHNIVESRPLFLRERSNGYYSPASWLLARLVFDVLPLRIIPTIIVSTM
jgi:hypothetical protein